MGWDNSNMSNPNKSYKYEEKEIKLAAELLRSGGIVAYPTDTVYGLGADIFHENAVFRIYQVKKRSLDLPLPVLLSSDMELGLVARDISQLAYYYIEKFWPGALTLLLYKSKLVPDLVTANTNKIALRIPNHSIPLTIIRELGKPIIGTSANISGQSNPLTNKEVESQLGGNIDLIIHGGRCTGIESTIIDVTGEKPFIIRSGAISDVTIQKAYQDYVNNL